MGSISGVSHHRVGGVTDWKGSVSTSRWEFTGWAPKVQQSVSQVIEYSEKPTVVKSHPLCAYQVGCSGSGFNGPWAPVVFHTYVTRTNWGAPALLSCELVGALDLPVWLMGMRICCKTGSPLSNKANCSLSRCYKQLWSPFLPQAPKVPNAPQPHFFQLEHGFGGAQSTHMTQTSPKLTGWLNLFQNIGWTPAQWQLKRAKWMMHWFPHRCGTFGSY